MCVYILKYRFRYDWNRRLINSLGSRHAGLECLGPVGLCEARWGQNDSGPTQCQDKWRSPGAERDHNATPYAPWFICSSTRKLFIFEQSQTVTRFFFSSLRSIFFSPCPSPHLEVYWLINFIIGWIFFFSIM